MTAKYSHIITETDYRFTDSRVSTACGATVGPSNLKAVWFAGSRYARPLCPKCAALALIAEVNAEVGA